MIVDLSDHVKPAPGMIRNTAVITVDLLDNVKPAPEMDRNTDVR